MIVKSKNFALMGAAGFVAPRHMRAIKEMGHELIVALDPHDSVGVLDSYFPRASFFTEFERFDRHVEKLRQKKSEGKHVHYVSICSPNYLHDAHIRFALRIGAQAICEKPLVLKPWNLDAIAELEKETGGRVNTILQLRYHPAIVALKARVDAGPTDRIYDLDLAYVTSRGRWYQVSWKGSPEKSGGVLMNIGVHFFDMLCWVFGSVRENHLHYLRPNKGAGFLELERARIRWFLSTDAADLPLDVAEKGERTYRALSMDGEELEFSSGFTDLHTQSYQFILEGRGFNISDVRPSIELIHDLSGRAPEGLMGERHPLAREACRG